MNSTAITEDRERVPGMATKEPQNSDALAGGTPPPTSLNVASEATKSSLSMPQPKPPVVAGPRRPYRKWLLWGGGVAALAVGGYLLAPWVNTVLNTVSTDDAYVNGHVTYVAPRVKGQVARVLVDDNRRVKKGDLLVQLDKEPYLVEVARRQAALDVAQAKLVQARATVRSTLATTKALRYKLQDAIQLVRSQIQEQPELVEVFAGP